MRTEHTHHNSNKKSHEITKTTISSMHDGIRVKMGFLKSKLFNLVSQTNDYH